MAELLASAACREEMLREKVELDIRSYVVDYA